MKHDIGLYAVGNTGNPTGGTNYSCTILLEDYN